MFGENRKIYILKGEIKHFAQGCELLLGLQMLRKLRLRKRLRQRLDYDH